VHSFLQKKQKPMEITYKIALFAHIAAGFTALVTGFIAIIAQKGKKVHQKAGLTFFFSMIMVCVSAIIISLMKENQFLLHIGIFSFFLVYSGFRSVQNKSLYPNKLDWMVLALAIINCSMMLFSNKVVLIVFGAIGTYLAIKDAKLLYDIKREKEIKKSTWLIRHLGMMLGGYIATFTAFLVVNVSLEALPWLPWLLPTIIGTPLIAYWTRKYQPKKTNKV
jgi:uncharacterized membrane protein